MTKLDFLTRWKLQLDSNNRKMHEVALVEIVEMINKMKGEDSEKFLLLLINSDICNFLSENMSYRDQRSMLLLNKIISRLSETDRFFKNDFYRILKGFFRVLNSFPATSSRETETYHKIIFTSITNLVKR